ncbi:MAG: 3-isopropylmalate dehydratase [Rhodothermaceae bacterium]
MNTTVKGKVFVLGDNVDTDQIIPAQHLVYNINDDKERRMYGKYALSSVPAAESGLPSGDIPFVQEGEFQSEFTIIIAGKNFGCGSSREHAPLALQTAGVKIVIAESFARIFYRNAVDGGFIIPVEASEELNKQLNTGDEVIIGLEDYILYNFANEEIYKLIPPGDILPVVEAGGLFNYAKKLKMI